MLSAANAAVKMGACQDLLLTLKERLALSAAWCRNHVGVVQKLQGCGFVLNFVFHSLLKKRFLHPNALLLTAYPCPQENTCKKQL